MATVSGSFTGVGVSSVLQSRYKGETITVNISGTYNMTIQFEKATTPDELAWEVVAGPWSTANATVLEYYETRSENERLRLRVTVDNSGTATYSFSDEDKVLFDYYDGVSRDLFYQVAESGVTFQKDVTFAADASITGDLTVTGTSTLTGAQTSTATPVTTANVGTANTGVTAVEYGDGVDHTTVLTVSVTDAVDIADNAALADGYLLYTFPAGLIVVEQAYMTMALSVASTEAQADTPDVGLGTVIASGAVATLDGTGTFEDLLTGQTAADSNGTATVALANPTAGVPFLIPAASAHTVHFNIADTWADDTGGDLTGDIAGTVVLKWKFLPTS